MRVRKIVGSLSSRGGTTISIGHLCIVVLSSIVAVKMEMPPSSNGFATNSTTQLSFGLSSISTLKELKVLHFSTPRNYLQEY